MKHGLVYDYLSKFRSIYTAIDLELYRVKKVEFIGFRLKFSEKQEA